MILPPKTILSCCIVGDDLHAARVTVGPVAARVEATAVVERFLSLPTSDAAGALRGVAGPKRVFLTAPSSWCAIRPVPITMKDWGKARSELMQSIDRLLPMTRDDAMAGLINLHDESLKPCGGRLIAIRRPLIEPWHQAIRNAIGAEVSAVLSPHMAMLGLGIQGQRSAAVLEPLGDGDVWRHEFAYGLPTALSEPATDARAQELTIATPEGARRVVSGVDLAAAAAVAPFVADGAFSPLDGQAPTRKSEWLAPAAALAAAAALMIAGPLVYEARLEAGLERLRAQQSALIDEFESVRELRRETERLAALLQDGVAAATADWRSALPVIAEAQAALPDDGFLYRLQVDRQSVTLSGEASDAPAILQRLEESPLLTSARRTGPLTPSSEPGLDVFEMRAVRQEAQDQP